MQLDSFIDRFNYLKLGGQVGLETFGFDRVVNQAFYNSKDWKKIRDYVIVRDYGCDLAIPDRPIADLGSMKLHSSPLIVIHHMNPVDIDDIINRSEFAYDPEYLICTSEATHKAIHYSDESMLFLGVVERQPNDTKLW